MGIVACWWALDGGGPLRRGQGGIAARVVDMVGSGCRLALEVAVIGGCGGGRGRRLVGGVGSDAGVADRGPHGKAGDPGSLIAGRLSRRCACGGTDPPPVGHGEAGGVAGPVRQRSLPERLGDGAAAGVPEQGPVGDVVVRAAGELAAAERLQQESAGFGQDVPPGELAAHGGDDRGDVDGGERYVHGRIHPGADRRPCLPAPVQESVDDLPAEAQDRGGLPPGKHLGEWLRVLLRGPWLLGGLRGRCVVAALRRQVPVIFDVSSVSISMASSMCWRRVAAQWTRSSGTPAISMAGRRPGVTSRGALASLRVSHTWVVMVRV
ncbi:hypothetical protein [Streptomyces sp. WMMB303]|uniref:hypothetical protein n=1 Tax=Streptomyces sp. WMMB303 TaxID=3034154 RepID=UPI0023EB5134|nr:hypothetical protein [Streptomyces sp. WMMB303]MDF4248781.1 hypothetical protein [Streptomyces sp. WMMB303]